MAATRKPKAGAPAPEEAAEEKAVSGDAGAADLQALADVALEQGFFGTTADPFPNEAYSLTSGPKSPSASEVHEALRGSPKEA